MTRRSFLNRAASFTIAQGALMQSFNSINALAQSTSSGDDYKAMVCVFLFGGNDSNNMLIPLDSGSLQMYAKARGTIALNPSVLLPLAGGQYGIHPSMPNVQRLYNSRNLGFLANIGPLVTPTTKAAFVSQSVEIPGALFSHPDQSTLMQTGLARPNVDTGWGGGIAQALAGSYTGTLPMCTSFFGADAFINGPTTPGFLAPGGGGNLFCSMGSLCDARVHGNEQMLSLPESNLLVSADQQLINRMLDLNRKYASATGQAPSMSAAAEAALSSGFPAAFRRILRMIQTRQALNANRQIFFVGLGGFDFHGDQLKGQASLLSALDTGLAAFANALQEIGMFDKVTTFTLSDFGRTLQSNGTGSDHGWGSHHMVMGGAIKGGDVYGTYPTLDVGGPDDSGDNRGRWIPTTSVSQLGATLATWFGVPVAAVNNIFPSLSNFSVQQQAGPKSPLMPLFS